MTKPDTFNRDVVVELQDRVERAKNLRTRITKLQAELLQTEKQFLLLSEIGSLQVKAGNVKDARETYARIARDYDQPGMKKEALQARLVRGWCEAQLNLNEEAFETFDALAGEAASIDMTTAVLAQFERARTLQRTGRLALAITDYRNLAEVSEGISTRCYAALQFQVGYIYLSDLEMHDEAATAFGRLDNERYANEPFTRLARELLP
jgi:tetratricopeptide (TPR) repeat protein